MFCKFAIAVSSSFWSFLDGDFVAVIQTKQKASPKWPQPVLLLVALRSGEIRDTDVCGHLKTREHIWATHVLPIPDTFSYTTEMSTTHRYLAGDTLRPFDESLVEYRRCSW
jgi:hypothetical protein